MRREVNHRKIHLVLVAMILVAFVAFSLFKITTTGNPVREVQFDENIGEIESTSLEKKTSTVDNSINEFIFQNLPSIRNQNIIYSSYDKEYTHCINKRDSNGDIVSCTGTGTSQRKFVPGEIIVKFKENSGIGSEAQAKNYLSAQVSQKTTSSATSASVSSIDGVKKISAKAIPNDINGLNRIYKIDVNKNADVLNAVAEYKNDPNIEYAEPNYIKEVYFTPNDPRFNEQWAHQITQAQEGWDIQVGSSYVQIAILDTGVDYNHEDLVSNIWQNVYEIPNNGIDDDNNGFIDDRYGWDFVNLSDASWCDPAEDCLGEDNNPMDFHGHGTHCAGIAGARTNNGQGIAGVCQYCNIIPIRAGWADPYGGGSLMEDDIVQGIIYAADNGADIISMSFGGGGSQAEKDALDYAYSKGVVLIAAAGNSGSQYKSYPAGYDNVISVSATDSSDYPAWFTNYGSWVDIAAPGVSILSTLPNNQYSSWSGTSMATPYVAGLVGLILSKNQNLTKEQVRNVLRTGVDIPNSDKYIGTGRVNVLKVLQMNSVPITNFDSSMDDLELSGNGTINIIGTASGDNFGNYTLEYGQGFYPTSWNLINQGSTQVVNGILGSFNSLFVSDGDYSLRLKSIDNLGEESVDKATVSIDNLKITNPIYRDLIRPGDLIEIKGDVFINPISYSVEYYTESIGSWSTIGITKTYPAFPGADLILATWNTSAINQPGFVFVKVTVNTIFGNFSEQTTIYADPDLKKGWPKKIEGDFINDFNGWGGYYMWAGPFDSLVADINNDGKNEIIFASKGTSIRLHALDISGDYINGWPIELPNSQPDAWESLGPIIGNVDDDIESEVIIGNNVENKLYAFNYDGSIVNGFPVSLYYKDLENGYSYGVNYGALNLADLNNDGKNEIIVFAEEPGYLAVYNNKGILLGSPYLFDTSLGSNLQNNPSVGNFDSDSDLEIVFAHSDYDSNTQEISSYIEIINQDGTLVSGWPIIQPDWVWNAPAVGDIDKDGQNEVVIAYRNGLGVYVYNTNGQLESGWPKLNGNYFTSSPSLIDLNKDGHLEIVISEYKWGSGNTYVLNYDGTEYSGWPQYKQMFDFWYAVNFRSPFNANDGSNQELIFETAGDKLYGWDKNGNTLDSFPKQTYGYGMTESGSYVGDIDNDGYLEIVASGKHDTALETPLPPLTKIMIWETTISKGNKLEWSQFHHDAQHTGMYGYGSATCTDTDSGSNAYTKGTLTVTNSSGTFTYADSCVSSTYLKEYYCQANQAYSTNVYCPVGCLSDSGACKRQTNTGCYTDPKTKKKVCPGNPVA